MTFIIIGLAITLQIYLSIKKVSPFISLLLVAILTGLFLGMNPMEVIKSMETGVGSTLSGLALILCLGAVLGKTLELSGAAKKISLTLIEGLGIKNIQWSLVLTGFLVGLPLYYNAGFIILVPLVFSIARETRLPLLYLAIPMAASLSTVHCFLPPHPSPVILVNAFEADLGKTLIYGSLIAIPAIIVAGPILGKLFKKGETHIVGIFSSKEDIPWRADLCRIQAILKVPESCKNHPVKSRPYSRSDAGYTGETSSRTLPMGPDHVPYRRFYVGENCTPFVSDIWLSGFSDGGIIDEGD